MLGIHKLGVGFFLLNLMLFSCNSVRNHTESGSELQAAGDGRCGQIAPWNPRGVTGHRTWYAGNLWTQVINNRVSGRTGSHPLLANRSAKQKELIDNRQIVAINAADVHKGIYDRMISICRQVVAAGGSVDDIDRRMYEAVRGGGNLASEIRSIIGKEVIGQIVKFRFATLDGKKTSKVYEFIVMDVFTMHGMAYDMGMISKNNNLGVREANQFIGDFDVNWLKTNADQMFTTTLILDDDAASSVDAPQSNTSPGTLDPSNLDHEAVPVICARFGDLSHISTCEKSAREGHKQSRRLMVCGEGKLKLCPGSCFSAKRGEHDYCLDAHGKKTEPLPLE